MSGSSQINTSLSEYTRDTVPVWGRKGSEGVNKELFGCLDPLTSTLF